MNKSSFVIAFTVALVLRMDESKSQSNYFPPLTGTIWETVSPDTLGWKREKIHTLMNFLESNNSKAFIVLKNGRIVLEQYFGTFTRDSLWYWASAGKSLTGFLVGIAQHDGILSIYDTTSQYLGAGWTSCTAAQEGLITVLHQLTMTTGLKDWVADSHCTLPECLVYQSDAGTRWAYHNAPYTLLKDVIEHASGQTINQYCNTKVRSRIGMNGLWFQTGYDNIYYSNARSMARFGLLILNRGVWDTDTLLADTSYFRRMTNTSQSLNPSYGYLWWLNGKASYMLPELQIVFPGSWAPDAPNDMISALGKNGQFINIVPSQNLVMVRTGEAPDSSFEVPIQFNNEMWQKFNDILYSQSTVQDKNELDRFQLNQNYPNPFNATTILSYEVSKYVNVRLRVFDILGREVATLVNGMKAPGIHTVAWNAIDLSSGIYFYKLQAGTYTETKKLMLLK